MADAISKGIEAVRAAETSLRDLIQAALSEGQYDRVAVLARWAEQLAQIGANGPADAAFVRAKFPETGSEATSRTPIRKGRTRAKRGKLKYPIFRRSGDALVKIAWSKASKSEYQHQAPKDIAVALLRKMQELGRREELLTMDEVLPLSTGDGAEVPAYQTYVCLAWLRTVGAVSQHGRKGYSVDSEFPPEQVIEQRWLELPVVKR